jgi:hypothetical protein
MQRLNGHWVAKRVGILDHYKSMTLAEIVLFDTYLLLANKKDWQCWRTIRQLEALLPMKRHTIISAKKALIDKGWITKINQTGVFIPKLYRYSGDMVQMGQQKVQNGQHSSPEEDDRMVHLGQQKVQNGQQGVQNGQQKVRFGTTIIEDEYIIEDDYLLSRSQNPDISGSGELLLSHPDEANSGQGGQILERSYLHLLKSISAYPFDFQKDLAFIRDLLVDFPTLDLAKEIKDWKTWLLDNKLKGKINFRSRLRKWLSKSVGYMEEQGHAKHGRHGGQRETHGEKRGRKGFDLPSDYPIDAGGIDHEEG